MVGLLVFGGSEVRRFERRAADDIRSKLSGADAKVNVKTRFHGLFGAFSGDLQRVTIRASDFSTEELPLYTEPGISTRGRVRNLDLVLSNFRLAGLRVEELRASIPDCRYDLGLAMSKQKIRLSRSGTGTGTVKLKDKDLAAYILKKFREIKRVEVSISNGRAKVEGYGEFLIVKTNFSVEAELAIVDGVKLVLANPTITFDGRPADELSRKVLMDTLNPVVDLQHDLRLYDAVFLRRIELGSDFLEASGDTKIPDAPEGKTLACWFPW